MATKTTKSYSEADVKRLIAEALKSVSVTEHTQTIKRGDKMVGLTVDKVMQSGNSTCRLSNDGNPIVITQEHVGLVTYAIYVPRK